MDVMIEHELLWMLLLESSNRKIRSKNTCIIAKLHKQTKLIE